MLTLLCGYNPRGYFPRAHLAVGPSRERQRGARQKPGTAIGVRNLEADETGVPAQLQVSEKSGKSGNLLMPGRLNTAYLYREC